MYLTDTKWLQANKTSTCWLQRSTSEQHILDTLFLLDMISRETQQIRFLKQWVDPTSSMMNNKTSTCILFTKKKKFSKFGFEAEAKYLDLILDKDHMNWYFFRRFKMSLYDVQVNSESSF